MPFMQQILQRKKKYLTNQNIKHKKLPHIVEFSTKHLIENGYIASQTVSEYFPDKMFTVDREFCWAVYSAVHPKESEKYFHNVLNQKLPKKKLNTHC